jgi:hypothetical protein
MAIDTKAKRMNMLSYCSPLAWQHHFEVDGAIDADDRAHLLHLYGGNALDSPPAAVAGPPKAVKRFLQFGIGMT